MSAADELRAIANAVAEAESRATIDSDIVLRLMLDAERIVGRELTRLRIAKAAAKLPRKD